MKFECGDLDRALANPELMAEAQEHLRGCAACRNEYRIWNEISSVAKELHCEWDSPFLWPKISSAIEADCQPQNRWWMGWRMWTVAAGAAAILVLALAHWPLTLTHRLTDNKSGITAFAGRDFLTDQALKEVELNEAAYRRSIDELSRLAQPKLESHTSSPILVSYREKLLMLDSAILETRSHVSQNRLNVCLQTELAGLYREKRHTLQEVLTDGKRN
jgi:hypothetical protein